MIRDAWNLIGRTAGVLSGGPNVTRRLDTEIFTWKGLEERRSYCTPAVLLGCVMVYGGLCFGVSRGGTAGVLWGDLDVT